MQDSNSVETLILKYLKYLSTYMQEPSPACTHRHTQVQGIFRCHAFLKEND